MDGFVEYQDDAVPSNNLYFSMLLREEDTALCDSISEVIGEMEADGTLDALKAQYIDDVIAGDDPENELDVKQMDSVAGGQSGSDSNYPSCPYCGSSYSR